MNSDHQIGFIDYVILISKVDLWLLTYFTKSLLSYYSAFWSPHFNIIIIIYLKSRFNLLIYSSPKYYYLAADIGR